jgi:diamine N-acetyltransferase
LPRAAATKLAHRRPGRRCPPGRGSPLPWLPDSPMHHADTHLRLRPTMLSDLDYVVTVERDPANLPFITPWERTQHEGAVRFPDFRHFIVEAGAGTERAGFVILQGCRNPHRSVELKRIVLQSKGHGLGRRCVRTLKQMAFEDLHAHRFWLDVKALNTRAQKLYASEGFVEEGRLRESVRLAPQGADGYDSLIVMSLLDREYQARVALGLEDQADL